MRPTTPSRFKTITVHCTCGARLVRYQKGPGRTLLKIHRDRITKDYAGVFGDSDQPEGTEIPCPSCGDRIATVRVVRGKYLYKVNRGKLGIIRKS